MKVEHAYMSVAFTQESLNGCWCNRQWRSLQCCSHQWIQASLRNWHYNTLKLIPLIIIGNNWGVEQSMHR
jgi:hypothetical protein